MDRRKILFLTGTRADYGKMKPLMKALDADPAFSVYVFVCGMHLSPLFGSTYEEVLKDKYENIHVAYGLPQTQDGGVDLGNTISYLSGYVVHVKPDMIIVHGDRMDALAGAVVGALNNVIVGHIEGGELSGTIDESIRHAISKFAHVHFVCTNEAKERLIQLGEEEYRINVIGSPDIDIMMSESLPTLDEARKRYDISFERYGILMYHPVTTEYSMIGEKIKAVVDAIIESEKNYIIIFPNNDLGSEIILNEYNRLNNNTRYRIFPSLRFEHFLTFLKFSDFIIGNSSAGIRESGVYGVPAIDIGTRQSGRYSVDESKNIIHVSEDANEIEMAIEQADGHRTKTLSFGDGNSTERFLRILQDNSFWKVTLQKHFIDLFM